MGGFFLFAATVGVVAQPLETSRVEVHANAQVTVAHMLPDQPSNPHELQGGAELGFTVYQHPLADDDAPYSLQPFLQRASTYFLSAGGGEASFSTEALGTYSRTRFGGGSAGLDQYLNRWVIVHASFSAQRAVRDGTDYLPPENDLSLGGGVGVGLRWNNTRFDLGYGIGGGRVNGVWQPTFFGGVSLGAFIVVDQKLAVSASARIIHGGVGLTAAFTGFITKQLGIAFSASASHGTYLSDDSNSFTTVGGSIGVIGWISRHLGFQLAYLPAWSSGAGDGVVTHQVTMAVFGRAR